MATLRGLSVFTYRIGFGDCFLLRFEYDDRRRHVLIDFGTSASPERMESQVPAIAEDIKEKCAGRLEAIVVTHRHSDHLSAFKGKAWTAIKSLRPRLVVLPWTEHPRAAAGARSAPGGATGDLAAATRRHLASLDAMHEVAHAALEELRRRSRRPAPQDGPDDAAEADAREDGEALDDPELLGPWAARDVGPSPVAAPFGKRVTAELELLGGVNLKNAAQVRNLLSLPAKDFVSFGSRTRLEELLPGVKVHVLGPPTLEQAKDLSQHDSPTEYWHIMAAAARASARAGGRPLFPDAARANPGRLPMETRWFLKRLDHVRANELLQIVRSLDAALNNTSVILLFEVAGPDGKRKLLFPGDAQIENWSYALSHDDVKGLLADVDVYKVGHHGSLNATPKTMWRLFEKRGPAGKAGRLTTLLSTRRGKHGSAAAGTEVPRKPLVDELQASSALVSTLVAPGGQQLCHETKVFERAGAGRAARDR